MRRRDQIGSKYNLPSSLNVGGYFTIKINRLRVNAYAKIAVNENARFSTFSNFFENVPTSQNRSNFAWGGFGVLFHIESKKVGVRIFREISYLQAPNNESEKEFSSFILRGLLLEINS